MNGLLNTQNFVQPDVPSIAEQAAELMPSPQEWVLISQQELRALHYQKSCLQAENARLKSKIDERDAQLVLKEAQIKDLKNRLFGKKTEKGASSSSKAKKKTIHWSTKRSTGGDSWTWSHSTTRVTR